MVHPRQYNQSEGTHPNVGKHSVHSKKKDTATMLQMMRYLLHSSHHNKFMFLVPYSPLSPLKHDEATTTQRQRVPTRPKRRRQLRESHRHTGLRAN
eukprot:4074674-Pyramimonas_sp.AAC.1